MTLTVLYDADCGFCQRSAWLLQRLDQRHRLSLVPLQVAQSAGTPTLEALLESLHAVDEHGRWWVGAGAIAEIARRVPLLRPLSLLARMPLAMTLLDAAYRLVARNRHRLSRALGMDACQPRRSVPTSGS